MGQRVLTVLVPLLAVGRGITLVLEVTVVIRVLLNIQRRKVVVLGGLLLRTPVHQMRVGRLTGLAVLVLRVLLALSEILRLVNVFKTAIVLHQNLIPGKCLTVPARFRPLCVLMAARSLRASALAFPVNGGVLLVLLRVRIAPALASLNLMLPKKLAWKRARGSVL
jgi:hypothetical protein